MNAAFAHAEKSDAGRTRVLVIACALLALGVGALVVGASTQLLLMTGVILLAIVAAMTVPLKALPLVAAAAVPFQLYFFIPGTNYATRAAVLFLAFAGLRLVLHLPPFANGRVNEGLSHVETPTLAPTREWIWIAPCGLFLLAAFIAAFAAPSRYDAFKGIYEWLPMMACLFIVALTVQSAQTFRHVIIILVIGGAVQAALGLVEYVMGLERVLSALATSVSSLFIPPNLLQERLSDLSFNWILSGRALPFGTFINGIDYAIFLAAIMMLAIVLAFSHRGSVRVIYWIGCAVVIGATALLTLKGSGFIALVGGAAALGLCLAPRLSRRTLPIPLALVVIAIFVALPFADSISQRAAFLIQREQSDYRDVGRLRIWQSLLSSFEQRPIFGYGLNSSEYLAEPTRTLRGGAFAFNPTSPESAYVETLIETGAVGFIALMSLFGVTLRRAYRRVRAGRDALAYGGVLAALVAVLLGNLTVSGFTTDQNGMLMGILIGLIFADWNEL